MTLLTKSSSAKRIGALGLLTALVFAALTLPGRPASGQQADLPWPECAPDAEAPQGGPPWPELPPPTTAEGNYVFHRPSLDPLADVLILAGAAVPLGPADESGLVHATIEVEEIVWRSEFRKPSGSLVPSVLPEETMVAIAEEETVREITTARTENKRVAIGLGAIDGATTAPYRLLYALDVSSEEPTYYGPYPFAERDTAQLRGFMESTLNPLPQAAPLALLRAWNVQSDAPEKLFPIQGELQRLFATYFARAHGLGLGNSVLDNQWNAIPPVCRSLREAPNSVLRPLLLGNVWLHVPAGWRDLSDAVLCLRVSLGSMGCVDPSTTSAEHPYVQWDEAVAIPGEPLVLQVARVKEGAVSWIERFEIESIDFDLFDATEAVLIELNPAAPTFSYDQVKNLADKETLATARSLGRGDHEALLDSLPKAQRMSE